ncbi:hypothetical protein B0T10DRAFT_581752 [Thelonectria olida]|uniref:Rhodopsin domain-containing protein n=1 Tax=Thelonectria olida TaxID=1576542 RepID=A0A9P8VVC6_9HYPO|nr:hypothetical protein B0T10DRAFT_581752 [Thelonectria olida]
MWNWTGPDSNSPAPPGAVPDYDNPIDVAWTRNVATMVVCDALVTVFFGIRIYVKIHINPRILVEDYTCAIAYCLIILYTVTVFMMAHYGAGYHSWEIKTPQYYNLLKWLYGNTVVYCPAAFFTKVTILLLMARVFAVEERVSKAIYIFIWALLIAYTPVQVIKTVVCTPIHSLWNPTVRNVRCVDQRKVFFGDVALAMLTDAIILLVPIPLTWRLHMPLRKKIKIVALLGAGGVATGITIFRTYKVAKFVNSDDLTVDYVDIDILAETLEQETKAAPACNPDPLATGKVLLQTHSTVEDDTGHGKEYLEHVPDEQLKSGRQL